MARSAAVLNPRRRLAASAARVLRVAVAVSTIAAMTVTLHALTGPMGAAAANPPPAPASPAPISSPRPEQKGRWGERTVAVGADLNGDGVNDMWVADPFSSNGGVAQAGTVYAVSGASLITHTGVPTPPVVIYTINPPVPTADQHFGYVITDIGDVNGDGVPDLAVGVDAATSAGALTGPGHVWV